VRTEKRLLASMRRLASVYTANKANVASARGCAWVVLKCLNYFKYRLTWAPFNKNIFSLIMLPLRINHDSLLIFLNIISFYLLWHSPQLTQSEVLNLSLLYVLYNARERSGNI
jgi:hypothetical protein